MTTSDYFLKKAKKAGDNEKQLQELFENGLGMDDDTAEAFFLLTANYEIDKRISALSDIIALFSDEGMLDDLDKPVWDGIRDVVNEQAGELDLELVTRIMQEYLKRFPL